MAISLKKHIVDQDSPKKCTTQSFQWAAYNNERQKPREINNQVFQIFENRNTNSFSLPLGSQILG